MTKKFLLSVFIVVLIFTGLFSFSDKAMAVDMSLKDFLRLLYDIGVIPIDKIPAADAFLNNYLNGIINIESNINDNTTTGNSACLDLARNLQFRSEDDLINKDVTKLQNFLSSKLFLKVTPNGYFGPATFSAAKLFQASNGIEATGFVGPITRAKIKSLTCSSGGGWSVLSMSTSSSSNLVATTTATSTVRRHRSSGSNTSATSTYTVTYNGNTNTGGTAPTDAASPYEENATVTVLDNTGSLVKTGYTFTGWNTQADGLGTARATSSTFSMPAANTTLYAVWGANNNTITFNTNGGDGGATAPQTLATAATANLTANGFTRTGYTFAGWATTTDGAVGYADAASYTMGTGDVTLYAIWTANALTYTVTFDGNTNTGGTVPADQTKTHDVTLVLATNSGTLVKTGYTFSGWNTAADGSGTSYAVGADYTANAGVTLFAKWTEDVPAADYAVTGSNTSGANGDYTYVADYEGYPYYTNSGGYLLHFSMMDSFWCIFVNTGYLGAPSFVSLHYRASTITGDYSDNGGGGTANVAPAASAATVVLTGVTALTETTATLNGEISATGGANPTVTVYWGDNDGGETAGSWDNNSAPTSPSQPQGVATFYKEVASLVNGTKYYYKAKSVNANGTSWSSTETFYAGAQAAGGTMALVDGAYIHTFTTDGNFTVFAGLDAVEVLVVGGGGGGGNRHGGGGGAGGVIYNPDFAVSSQTYSITVGSGGEGGNYGVSPNGGVGGNGGNSVFSTLTAVGGGGGSTYGVGGQNGGSGGGGSGASGQTGGTGTADQGNNGGLGSSSTASGGGGGGASATGTDATTAGGDGGDGVMYAISGSDVYYGGGGGGGGDSSQVGGAGGLGGGGHGGDNGGATNLTAGTDGTGGGGGGNRESGGVNLGAEGGSGVVIISYESGMDPSTSTITLSAATNLASSSATINGAISSTGGNRPTVTMYWGTTDGGTNPESWASSSAPTSPTQPQGAVAFYTNISGLSSTTSYYFSAKATNSVGTSWPAASLSFTPDNTPPVQSAWDPANEATIYTNTPTITLTLNENGDCFASTTDVSYGEMSGDTNCTGDGTTSISCTLPNLGGAGTKYIYISCRDTGDNADTAETNTVLTYTNDPPAGYTVSGSDIATVNGIYTLDAVSSPYNGYDVYKNESGIYMFNSVMNGYWSISDSLDMSMSFYGDGNGTSPSTTWEAWGPFAPITVIAP